MKKILVKWETIQSEFAYNGIHITKNEKMFKSEEFADKMIEHLSVAKNVLRISKSFVSI